MNDHMAARSTSPTSELAAWLATLSHDDVPSPVRTALRRLLLDTIGVGLFGASQPWTLAARTWAAGATPASTARSARVWGEVRASLRPADAALVNGIAVHAYELDDFHNAKLHPGAVVVPTVLALGEALNSDGAQLETAIAAGYEVAIRTALALGPSQARLRGWHLTAVCGTLGAAAASAVLLRLDERRAAWALGLAGTQSGGLFAFTADGSASKRFHAGRAAQAGTMAAELAELGFTGPTRIYEAADGGLLSTFVDGADAGQLTAELGHRWAAAETNFKPYPCCGSLHAHVDAALALRSRWRAGGRVRVGLSRVVKVQCGYDYQPGSELNAQMSARYCVAAAMLDGAVLPAQFAPSRIADDAITRLAQSIELTHDSELDGLYPVHFSGWVEAEGACGVLERMFVQDPSGSPRNPSMKESVHRKYLAMATPILGLAGADRLAELVEKLDNYSAIDVLRGMVIPSQ